MNIQDLNEAADAAVDLLKALANPTRLKLVCQLVDGERSVGEIAQALGVRDTAVSQHLALLRRDGIVVNRRSGQTIYYSIGDPAAARLVEQLHAIFCGPGGVSGKPRRRRAR
jgi:DNA-binding transcriptional ArsR family regulator